MVALRRSILRLFFALEIVIFCLVYLFGNNGIVRVRQLQRENGHIAKELHKLEQEIDIIDQKIVAWHHNPFYKEKVAREQLQLAREGDEIYYIGT